MSGIALYDYQIDAVNRMHNGCILCGGVGSGKSRTALAYYYICMGGKLNTNAYVKMIEPLNLYIITTARKRDTKEWEDEFLPFHFDIYNGLSVTVDSWNSIQKYKEIKDSFFIFDEQRAVGKGAWSKTFVNIAKKNKWILLSATPGDTWMDYVPVFIANGYFKNRTEFYEYHVVMKRNTQFPQIDHYVDEHLLETLRDSLLITMDYSRPTTSHHEDILVEHDRMLYKSVMKNRWDIYKDCPIDNSSAFCGVLRRLVNTDVRRQWAVLDILKDHKRAIIFYNFDYELDILRKLEYADGTEIAEWNGHEHQKIPDSKRWVYLVQYVAGAEGWNCITTNCMIFFSENYSYKIMQQAAGRIDRMNTPFYDLYYYHLRSAASIDLAIRRALNSKRQFTEAGFYRAVETRKQKRKKD